MQNSPKLWVSIQCTNEYSWLILKMILQNPWRVIAAFSDLQGKPILQVGGEDYVLFLGLIYCT
ncbi:hypothetical protein SAMN04488028_102518 [Reichenbachiella agariperforans]|uniref:Uncharacterized protein n=1 Tax=Reichenbachiella agariperforans TaxID=156994 RepID=A0A1M6P2F6_REIAG|nr:hypothetical protein SAMN04488028_102518 [Reichenbachiella agariperforans]